MRILCISLILLTFNFLNAQSFDKNYFQNKYLSTLLSKENISGDERIKAIAKGGNVNNFIVLGYYIDANNLYFLKNKSSESLKKNREIISILSSTGSKLTQKSGNVWKAKIGKNDINNAMDGKEFMLYEGYLFRYIAEYIYISKDLNYLPFLENNFNKWYESSYAQYQDESIFYGSRLHMGSHWATVALYLHKLTKNSSLKSVCSRIIKNFDLNLKKNLVIKKKLNSDYYVWNSTYNNLFNNYLQSLNYKSWNKNSEIQDFSHGNHIIQYVISSYHLGNSTWNLNDLKRFSNTLKLITWNGTKFTSLVNGKESSNSNLRNSTWKVSDGWMKLIQFDQSLRDIFVDFYKVNLKKIDSNAGNLQFYVLMS